MSPAWDDIMEFSAQRHGVHKEAQREGCGARRIEL